MITVIVYRGSPSDRNLIENFRRTFPYSDAAKRFALGITSKAHAPCAGVFAADGTRIAEYRSLARNKFLAALTVALLLVLAACTPLAHVPPQSRTPEAAQLASVRLEIVCKSDGTVYADPRVATGVVISEQHILTVGHAVVCPVLPRIKATLADGRTFRMYVERDEFSFGDGRDIARLKLASADRFRLGAAPPELGDPEEAPDGEAYAFAVVYGREMAIGVFRSRRYAKDTGTRDGDSGAGVYSSCGKLVGIVTHSVGENHSKIEPVDRSWLEGT